MPLEEAKKLGVYENSPRIEFYLKPVSQGLERGGTYQHSLFISHHLTMGGGAGKHLWFYQTEGNH